MIIYNSPYWNCINGLFKNNKSTKYCFGGFYWMDLIEVYPPPQIGDSLMKICEYCNEITTIDYVNQNCFRLFKTSFLTARYFGYVVTPSGWNRGKYIPKYKWDFWKQDFIKYEINAFGEYEIPWSKQELEKIKNIDHFDRVKNKFVCLESEIFKVHKRWRRTEDECYRKWLELH